MTKLKSPDKKWWEDSELTVHAIDGERQVRVYYFPNMPEGQPKLIQFQLYGGYEPAQQLADLLESALTELRKY